MTAVLKMAGAGLILMLVYWAVLFLTQRRLMYPAPLPPEDVSLPDHGRRVWLPGAGGRTEAWYLPALPLGERPAALMFFGHGNGELIDYWGDAFETLRRRGVAIMLVEYPGYGRSEGSPTEQGIRAAFRVAYDWAAEHSGLRGDQMVGYGRSLGGGAVAALSLDRPLAALILESTFTSTRPFARRLGAPGFLARDVFDNLAAVKEFDGPLLVLHGAHDDIIPIAHGRRLADAGNGQLHELSCGHNDCPPQWDLVLEFLGGAKVLSPS